MANSELQCTDTHVLALDTLFCLRANQSLSLLFTTMCLVEKLADIDPALITPLVSSNKIADYEIDNVFTVFR
jgi:hypothetical protein